MDLIYLANIRFPTEKAHGRQIAKMAEAWLLHQEKITLIIPSRRQMNHFRLTPQSAYQLKTPLLVKKLWCLDFLQFSSSSSSHYLETVAFFIQSLTFSLSTFFSLLVTPPTPAIYTRNLYVVIPLFLLTKRIFIEIHDLPRTSIGVYLHRFVLTHASGTIFISSALAAEYKRLNILPSYYCIAHDGVDVNLFIPPLSKTISRKILQLPLNQKIIVYTGSFYNHKGVIDLVNATPMLPNNTRVLFIGGSVAEASTQQLSQLINTSINHKCQIIPFKKMPDLIPYLFAADVLVLPTNKQSRANAYSSPLKLFTYLAAGRPIVASNLPAFKEIITHRHALLIKPGSPSSLAQGINWVLRHPKQAHQLASEARKLAFHHTWVNRAQNITQFIEQHV